MRLSDAIRLGAMLKPQGFGPDSINGQRATCAIGAALDAIGAVRDDDSHAFTIASDQWPWLQSCVDNPLGRCMRTSTVIWQLNDNACWTREQIADWLETVEMGRARNPPVAAPELAECAK